MRTGTSEKHGKREEKRSPKAPSDRAKTGLFRRLRIFGVRARTSALRGVCRSLSLCPRYADIIGDSASRSAHECSRSAAVFGVAKRSEKARSSGGFGDSCSAGVEDSGAPSSKGQRARQKRHSSHYYTTSERFCQVRKRDFFVAGDSPLCRTEKENLRAKRTEGRR